MSGEWAHPSVLTEKENMGLWKAAKLFLGELGEAIRNTSESHNSLKCVSPNTGHICEGLGSLGPHKAVCHYFPIPSCLPSQIPQTSSLSAGGGSGELSKLSFGACCCHCGGGSAPAVLPPLIPHLPCSTAGLFSLLSEIFRELQKEVR